MQARDAQLCIASCAAAFSPFTLVLNVELVVAVDSVYVDDDDDNDVVGYLQLVDELVLVSFLLKRVGKHKCTHIASHC